MKHLIVITSLSLCMLGCSRTEARATLTGNVDGKTEIMLVSRFLTAGGPCTGPTLPRRDASVDWLYLPVQTTGRISFENVVVTDERGDFSGAATKDLGGGYIDYDGGTLEVRLLIKSFDQSGRVTGQKAYRHNGTYQIASTPPPPPK